MADEKTEQPQQDEGNDGGQQYDAPNQQAVGGAHPSEEGTGGSSGETKDAGDARDTEDTDDLDSMTKAQLLEYAKSKGITPANNDMTKEELRASIDEAER